MHTLLRHLLTATLTFATITFTATAPAASIIPVFQLRTVSADSIVSTPSQQDFENISAPDFNEFDALAEAKISNANALSQTSAGQHSTIDSCALTATGQTFAHGQSAASGFHGYSISSTTCYLIFDIDEPVEYLIHGNLDGSEFGGATVSLQTDPVGSGVLFYRTAENSSLDVHHRAQLSPARYILYYHAGASAAVSDPAEMTNTGDFDLQFTLCFIPADINYDGAVNIADLLALIASWGACPGEPQPCAADITLDTLVNVNDLLALISAWTN
ncbi:MAG: hypothetical protein L0Y44_10225 [Phycisphaerales bacterium]|nr:hypothetical protein [Phycisphaerales bacterium]